MRLAFKITSGGDPGLAAALEMPETGDVGLRE
jgi:hypothetical protein